jgi:hypothetical protein
MLFGETQELQNILDASRHGSTLDWLYTGDICLQSATFSVKPKNCRTLLMLLGTVQSLIDCIFAGGIAIEAHNARDLLNILVMPIDLGTGGLDLSTPAIVLPDSASALALASASISQTLPSRSSLKRVSHSDRQRESLAMLWQRRLRFPVVG